MKLTLVKSLDEIKKEKDGYYDISALYGIIRGAMWCENNVLYIGQNLEYEVKEDSIQAIVDVVEQNKEEIEKELDNINGTHKLFELGKKIEAHMEDKRDALAKYGIKGINLGIGVREDEDYRKLGYYYLGSITPGTEDKLIAKYKFVEDQTQLYKFIGFKNNLGEETGLGFIYGLDLNSISRTVDSD